MNSTASDSCLEVVALVHGIRSLQSWGDMVKRILEVEAGVTQVFPIKYGFWGAWRLLLPVSPRVPLHTLERSLDEIVRQHPNAKISVIAHSFGAYLIHTLLVDKPTLHLKRLVLCGAVLPPRTRWDQVAQQVDHVIVNECGNYDVWPFMAHLFGWRYGPSGAIGFGTPSVVDRIHHGGHSMYLYESFVKTWWLPLFASGDIVTSEVELTASGLKGTLATTSARLICQLLVVGITATTLLTLPVLVTRSTPSAVTQSNHVAPATPNEHILAGEVLDSVTRRPLSGVIVALPEVGEQQLTSVSGRYQFRLNVPFGQYVRLRAYREAYKSIDEDLRVGGRHVDVIYMEPMK